MRKRNEKGFTLIEMLLVVIIITTLAAMIVPRFTGRAKQAKVAAASTDIQSNIADALDLYEMDNGNYPTTEQGLVALLQAPVTAPVPKLWRGPYFKKKGGIKDPWGDAYIYRCPGIHNVDDYDLYSFGPSGIDGDAGNITNWDEPPKS